MEYRKLYEMISYLEYGTNLHIGVLFFNNYGNEMCHLPEAHKIHSAKICESIKNISVKEYKRCFKCRNLAIQKAIKTKTAFGGLCINGVYEYTHPVIINDDLACIIYIGNILCDEENNSKLNKWISREQSLLNTMERDFGLEKCMAVADIIEGHIRILLEKYTYKNSDVKPLIRNIQDYINVNLEFDVNISQIAKLFHYNERYIGQLFKKETGETICEFINYQRLERAKLYLATTHDTVINIALKTGFNNVTYFNRVFKKLYGMTPTQYRKLHSE